MRWQTYHYVGHLIDLPRWTQGYDHYYLKIKLDGAWIEPPQKKYGVRVFANGEMIKEYSMTHEVIRGWERIPLDKRIIEDQKKLYVSLQVFGPPMYFRTIWLSLFGKASNMAYLSSLIVRGIYPLTATGSKMGLF